MAVNANALETYDTTVIRENLQEALINISPTETVFMSSIGTKSVDNTYFEWTTVSLSAAADNRVAEGDNPSNDSATLSIRRGNYCQLSDKVVEVTSTAEASNSVSGNATKAKQVALKLQELKRDMEKMMLDNSAASAGSGGTARKSAGLPTWLTSNVSRGTGGASGTTSGSGASGYPNAAATDASNANKRALTEALLKTVIASCWDAGAEPAVVLCGSAHKQAISGFDGDSTKYQNMSEYSKLNAAISVYVSDFGSLQIIPSRHIRTREIFVLDPNHARMAYLQEAKQEPLAKTGHAERTLISCEYGLQVDTEAAHGVVADLS